MTCIDSCPDTKYHLELDDTYLCVQECPLGYFQEEETNDCEECHDECLECYGSTYTSCYQCNDGFYLYGDTCIDECPLGYVENKGGECQA